MKKYEETVFIFFKYVETFRKRTGKMPQKYPFDSLVKKFHWSGKVRLVLEALLEMVILELFQFHCVIVFTKYHIFSFCF